MILIYDTNKRIVIVHNISAYELQHFIHIDRQILHRSDNCLADLLNTVGGLTTIVSKHTDLICHNRKAPSRFSRTCRLNGCIQRKQVGLSGNT